jgi:hypothetical protein
MSKEELEETCEAMGGEVKEFEDRDANACVLKDEGVVLQQDGEFKPLHS